MCSCCETPMLNEFRCIGVSCYASGYAMKTPLRHPLNEFVPSGFSLSDFIIEKECLCETPMLNEFRCIGVSCYASGYAMKTPLRHMLQAML